MFLSKEELKDVMLAYGYEDSIEKGHYEVGPDTWIYLFEHEDKKYILITTDYLGDYDFDSFPHTLSFDSIFRKNKFTLQREVPSVDDSVFKRIHVNAVLFEYTD